MESGLLPRKKEIGQGRQGNLLDFGEYHVSKFLARNVINKNKLIAGESFFSQWFIYFALSGGSRNENL